MKASNNPDPSPGPPTHPWSIWAALIAVYLIWGSTYLAIRFAVESLPPFTMSGVRFLFAGAVLYAWRRARGDAAPSGGQWRSAAIVGLFLLAGGNGGVVWAEQHVVSSVAALLVGIVPLWMVLIDLLHPTGHRRPSWKAGLGVLTGFGGVALLIGPSWSGNGVGHVDRIGALAVILAALLWSIGSLYSRNAELPSSPLLATSIEMITGGAGLLVLGAVGGEWARLDAGAISSRSLLAFGYLVVFGSWVAFTAYTWLLRAAPTALVSTYAYVNPLVAIVLGHVLAGEPLTARTLLAAAIIVGSVALITAVRPGEREAQPGGKRSPRKLAPAEQARGME